MHFGNGVAILSPRDRRITGWKTPMFELDRGLIAMEYQNSQRDLEQYEAQRRDGLVIDTDLARSALYRESLTSRMARHVGIDPQEISLN